MLSLSTSHSFELDEVWRYLNSRSAEPILIQALLDAPLFGVRWRWNAGVAMALPRFVGGRKVAPQIQRMKSEDLVAAVFPDQIACLENIAGERQIPDHPLVEQTLDDCLHEAMDSEGWLALLRRMESGAVRLLCRDLPAPRRWHQRFSTPGLMPFWTMRHWKNDVPRRCSTGAGTTCTVATTWARWTLMPLLPSRPRPGHSRPIPTKCTRH